MKERINDINPEIDLQIRNGIEEESVVSHIPNEEESVIDSNHYFKFPDDVSVYSLDMNSPLLSRAMKMDEIKRVNEEAEFNWWHPTDTEKKQRKTYGWRHCILCSRELCAMDIRF